MKEQQSEAIVFGDWILENAYQSYLDDELMWEFDDVLYTTRDLYIEFINQQLKK